MFNILVVDNDGTTHKKMEILLSQRDDLSRIHYAHKSGQAINALQQYQFDIVLLDVQMPLENCLKVAQYIQPDTAVVFLTSTDLPSVDYVFSPINNERLDVAIEYAVRRLNSDEPDSKQLFDRVVKSLGREQIPDEASKLVLKEVGKIKLINMCDIKFVKGAGNYVEIVLTDNKTLLHRETLSNIETRLCARKFSRIHKSTIVRNDLIIELRPTPKGDYVVRLNSGDELMLSRRNKDKLKRLLKID